MAATWYPIKAITFNKPQMRWLINNLADLKDGDWPLRPGEYNEPLKRACKAAREKGYEGYCIGCPFMPCLHPSHRTPNRIRKERSINRVLEIAAEVEIRIELVLDYISGEQRPTRVIKRQRRE